MPDVEMKSVEEATTTGSTESTTEPEVKKDPDLLTIEDIREQVKQLEKAVYGKDFRYSLRVLRCLGNTRRKLNANVLRRLIHGYYTHSAKDRQAMENFIIDNNEMEVDGENSTLPNPKLRASRAEKNPLIPEVDAYLHLLVLLSLIDAENTVKAAECSDALMAKLKAHNRRSLDLVAARCFFYHSRAYEMSKKLEQIRPFLHARLRTATLRNDYEGQAVLINCLLRNYLFYNLYDQADKLVSKSVFPETASNNEWARYLYYLGRIKAVQLDYSAAHKHLVQALRKAPQHAAIGFKQTVQKLTVTVELLLGDIPERSIFHQATLKRSLAPYFKLTQAVRLGNLQMFIQVLEEFHTQFQQDRTYILIQRLRHNVIKTGLRAISTSYSKISLQDCAQKLALDAPEDAEFIVAKAIRDGVIEATIDHEAGFVASKERSDVYCTQEPQLAFHQRISFCLNIHNQSVKAMRFPPKSYNKDLESAEERREREQQDLELAKEMAEDDEDFI
jgi:26S proteasome regulatory subunit N3